ncbi:hypothetical protein [Vineibacter terrae]|uniref:hypothetical protein n=1 Tax=Vineibacter terrae TaxID=2586908 RepID=UPI002E35A737|nr:hypothetical protein [Vineibacter terrae]HEX2887182.1 hypothetical protein [Vineibacter terrae]
MAFRYWSTTPSGNSAGADITQNAPITFGSGAVDRWSILKQPASWWGSVIRAASFAIESGHAGAHEASLFVRPA